MPLMARQGTVEVLTCERANTSLLAQQLYVRLALEDSLQTATQVLLTCILYANKALRDLGTFVCVTSHFFSAAGQHASAVTDLLRLI